MDDSDVFHILGNDRRRELINSIARTADPVPLAELATEVATCEAEGKPPEDLYRSVYVSLQQTHLPKMADAGIVVYDREAKVVRPGPTFDEVEAYVSRRGYVPNSLYSTPLVVSIVALVVVVAATLGVPVVSDVDVAVWAVISLLSVIGTLAAQSVR